uniref:Geranylgeranyl transferase type-2 subunit alpha n=1 Tax=Theileria parva TaxID=5875 RepID=Q4N176_THEPA|eukprot:XP_764510.1 RAB geranylgeranyltransferase subunit alpha [Theileria parva strain Muguga]
MHGLKSDDFYKTSEEREQFKKNLEKGFKVLDLFVDYSSKLETSAVFGSVLNRVCESDKKMFDLSSVIIEFMPEFTPAWNYRKRFIQKNQSNDKSLLLDSLKNERALTYASLKKSPKSYSVWHHRLWSIASLFNLEANDILEVLLEEVTLCFKLFTHDGRNFHCWNYFNFIKHYLNLLKPESESVKLKGAWKPTKLNLGISLLWSFVVDSDEDLQGLFKLELVVLNTRIEYYSLLLNNPNFFVKKADKNEESGYSRIKLVYGFSHKNEVDLESLKVYDEQDDGFVENNKVSKPIKVGSELLPLASDVTLDILRNQLNLIDELISLDSERKYLLLTKLKIKKCSLNEYIKVDFGNLSLSRFDFRTLLPFFGVIELNLSKNKLTSGSLSDISSFLLLLEALDLSENNIEDLESALYTLRQLKRLKRLNLSGNPLKVLDHDTKLQSQIE